MAIKEKEKTSDHKLTFSVIPEPNQTSPETFKLSSSTMLGMDLNRARKLATYLAEGGNYLISACGPMIPLQLEGMEVFTDQWFHLHYFMKE